MRKHLKATHFNTPKVSLSVETFRKAENYREGSEGLVRGVNFDPSPAGEVRHSCGQQREATLGSWRDKSWASTGAGGRRNTHSNKAPMLTPPLKRHSTGI